MLFSKVFDTGINSRAEVWRVCVCVCVCVRARVQWVPAKVEGSIFYKILTPEEARRKACVYLVY